MRRAYSAAVAKHGAFRPPIAGKHKTYFLQGELTKLIKIGRTLGSPEERIKELQQYCPDNLIVLKVVTFDIEQRLHRRFAPFRVRGEWFTPAQPLLDFIASL